MRPPSFIHGTSGWCYNDWVGPFYPPGTPERKFLEFYATRFPGVEVDSTFYRIPSAKTADAWNKATPEGFLFSPKMVQEVTHERFLEGAGDVAARFLDALAPLGPKLGPVVLQFPYFKKAEGLTLDAFLARLLPFLDALPKPSAAKSQISNLKSQRNLKSQITTTGEPQGESSASAFAVEVRNKTFLKPALLDALRDRGTALVLNDHPWMPRPEEWLALPGVFTAPSVPIRLLGDRYAIERPADPGPKANGRSRLRRSMIAPSAICRRLGKNPRKRDGAGQGEGPGGVGEGCERRARRRAHRHRLREQPLRGARASVGGLACRTRREDVRGKSMLGWAERRSGAMKGDRRGWPRSPADG
jgi:uncharacterized protein YecE (DUF72 family)